MIWILIFCLILVEIYGLLLFNYLFDRRFHRALSKNELENYQIIRRITTSEIFYKSRRAFHSRAFDHLRGFAQRKLDEIHVPGVNIAEMRVMGDGFHANNNLYRLEVGVRDKAGVIWYPIKFRITNSELEEIIPSLYKFAKESSGNPIPIVFDNSEIFRFTLIVAAILLFVLFYAVFSLK